MPQEMYAIEHHDKRHWVSVFPSARASESQNHASLEDAETYMRDEQKVEDPIMVHFRFLVACTDSNGEPEIWFGKGVLNSNSYFRGEGYEKHVTNWAKDEGYGGPFVVFMEGDSAFYGIEPMFRWDTASQYRELGTEEVTK